MDINLVTDGAQRSRLVDFLLGSVKGDGSLTAVRQVIDQISLRCSVVNVVRIVGACQRQCASNPRDEMRLLIPVGFWLVGHDPPECERVVERLLALVSGERPLLSASVFALRASLHYYGGRFAQAIEALDGGFTWLEHHHIDDGTQLATITVIVANRLGHHDLALQYAYKCYEKAFYSESSGQREMANLLVISSARLVLQGGVSLCYDIEKSLSLVERGQSKLVLANQQILPIYAASAELASERPDWHRIERWLGLVDDLNALGSHSYNRRAYYLTIAKLHRLKGQARRAKGALLRSRLHCHAFDFNFNLEDRFLSTELGIAPANQVAFQPLEKQAWYGLESGYEVR